MAYATITELAERMTLPASYTGNADLVARLTDALDSATGLINDDTGRDFTQRSSTKTFPTRHLVELDLPDFRSITTLKVDDNDDGVFETTIAASGYETSTWPHTATDGFPSNRIRLLDRHFPMYGRREYRIEVVADWGWAAVPSSINKACTILAARLAAREGSAAFGVQSFGAEGGGAYIRTNDPDYMHNIRRYIRSQVA